jgi:hypothetical protein
LAGALWETRRSDQLRVLIDKAERRGISDPTVAVVFDAYRRKLES